MMISTAGKLAGIAPRENAAGVPWNWRTRPSTHYDMVGTESASPSRRRIALNQPFGSARGACPGGIGRSRNSDQGHGNPAPEAYVYIGPWLAGSFLVVAGVDEAAFLPAKLERQRRGIERAEDNLGVGPARFGMREIDVPECTGFPG